MSDDDGAGDLTLAFELGALRRLAAPAAAVADARSWAARVGVVSVEAPERVRPFAERAGFVPDFVGSATGETDGLAVVRRQYPAARHVLVGAGGVDAAAVRSLGWEYVDVAEAADAAGWSLAEREGRWRADDGAPGG